MSTVKCSDEEVGFLHKIFNDRDLFKNSMKGNEFFLTEENKDDAIELISDELMNNGIDASGNITEYGKKLDNLISKISSFPSSRWECI